MGSGSRVADRQGDRSVEDSRTKCRWGCSDELCFIVIVMGAPRLFSVVGTVPVDVVDGENKTHAFVGWLSGRKNCFNRVEPFNMLS